VIQAAPGAGFCRRFMPLFPVRSVREAMVTSLGLAGR